MSKQRGPLIQGHEGFENEEIRGGGGLDVTREGEIKDIDDHRVGEDGGVCIIRCSV